MDSRKLWPNQMVSFFPLKAAGAAAYAVEDEPNVETRLPPAVVAARPAVSFNIERRDILREFCFFSDITAPSILLLRQGQLHLHFALSLMLSRLSILLS